MNSDIKYMKIAIREAKKAFRCGDVPIGTIIVKNDKIISKAHNEKEKKYNSIKHSEIIAIEKACKKLKTWHLEDCIIYSTLEPCIMCTGAIIQSRIKTINYSLKNENFGAIDSKYQLLQSEKNIKITSGLCEEETKKILSDFFSLLR